MNRWVVLGASFLAQVLQYGIVWTVGMFNMLFLEAFQQTHAATALISSLNSATFFLAGPFAGALVNRFGHRLTAFAGGLIGALGIMLSSFATSITFLYISFGLITGIGLGICYVPTLTIVGLHFDGKLQSVAFAISMSGVGIGMLIFPFIVQSLADHYGWRGATMITGAIMLNLCTVGLLMKSPEKENLEKTKESTEKNVFNFKVFKNISFVLFCLNNAFFFFGHSIISVHLPSYALTLGIDHHQAAYLVSISGIASFVGRFVGGALSLTQIISQMNIYVTCMLLCTAATLMAPMATSYIYVSTYSATFGILLGCFCVKLPSVVIQILDVKLLASAYGYMLLFEAIGALLGAPLSGYLYDVTHDYTVSFMLAAACMLVAALLMIPPWVLTSKHCVSLRKDHIIDRVIDEKKVSLEAQHGNKLSEPDSAVTLLEQKQLEV